MSLMTVTGSVGYSAAERYAWSVECYAGMCASAIFHSAARVMSPLGCGWLHCTLRSPTRHYRLRNLRYRVLRRRDERRIRFHRVHASIIRLRTSV